MKKTKGSKESDDHKNPIMKFFSKERVKKKESSQERERATHPSSDKKRDKWLAAPKTQQDDDDEEEIFEAVSDLRPARARLRKRELKWKEKEEEESVSCTDRTGDDDANCEASKDLEKEKDKEREREKEKEKEREKDLEREKGRRERHSEDRHKGREKSDDKKKGRKKSSSSSASANIAPPTTSSAPPVTPTSPAPPAVPPKSVYGTVKPSSSSPEAKTAMLPVMVNSVTLPVHHTEPTTSFTPPPPQPGSLLSLTETVKEHEVTLHLLALIKEMSWLENVLGRDQNTIVREFFETGKNDPPAQVLEMLYGAMDVVLDNLTFRAIDMDLDVNVSDLRTFLLDRNRAKDRLLNGIMHHPEYVPLNWGGGKGRKLSSETRIKRKVKKVTST